MGACTGTCPLCALMKGISSSGMLRSKVLGSCCCSVFWTHTTHDTHDTRCHVSKEQERGLRGACLPWHSVGVAMKSSARWWPPCPSRDRGSPKRISLLPVVCEMSCGEWVPPSMARERALEGACGNHSPDLSSSGTRASTRLRCSCCTNTALYFFSSSRSTSSSCNTHTHTHTTALALELLCRVVVM
jgi:hypothetical protein